MFKYILIIFACLIAACSMAQNGEEPKEQQRIGLHSEFSYKMLEPNENLRKVFIFITERQKGNVDAGSLVIGSSLIALGDYQRSNRDSKFGYLMRHPTASNQIGKEVSEAVIHSFQFSFSGAVNSWLAAHAEMLYNPQQSFGTGLITGLERNQVQLRKAFLLFGDLNRFPIYGAIGKMDAPFGQMGTVNPFTNTTMWHAFGGLGYGAQVGYKKGGLHATVMLVQGGAQFRALSTPVGDSTNVPSQLNNFTADINYTLDLGNEVAVKIGGSYLYGSAYCHQFPVFHFDPCNDNNPAWTAYGKVSLGDRIVIKGGYAQTQKVWPGTKNPNPPLDVFEAAKVSSKDIGLKYTFASNSSLRHSLSGEFSDFRAGPDGAPWERQNQFIVGYAVMIKNSSKLFLELFRTEGYVPLNWVSGSGPFAPFPPGETHSERDAQSHGIVLGGQITF